MEKYLEIGKIVKAQGIKGELKVMNLSDFSDRFEQLEWVYVNRKGKREKHNIQNIKYINNFVILKLDNIDDMTTAETYRDSFIEIDKENALKLPEGSFFICDIIGSEVSDEKIGRLGKLTDVIQTGSNDVYVVRRDNGKDILIPALKSVVMNVDIEKGVILVRLPEGLMDDEV